MSINIQMNILNSDNTTYETLYPQTLGSLISGTVSSAQTLSQILSLNLGGTGGNYESLEELRIAMGASKVTVFNTHSLTYIGTGTPNFTINLSGVKKGGRILSLLLHPQQSTFKIGNTNYIPYFMQQGIETYTYLETSSSLGTDYKIRNRFANAMFVNNILNNSIEFVQSIQQYFNKEGITYSIYILEITVE